VHAVHYEERLTISKAYEVSKTSFIILSLHPAGPYSDIQ
jgi:hypothetical protein